VLNNFKGKIFLNGESMVGRWWGISTIVSPSKWVLDTKKGQDS
jgi:hypothetical protein